MGAGSTQVVVPGSGSHQTRAPPPSPSGSFWTSRTSPAPPAVPPSPRAAKLARGVGQHPAPPARRPWLGSPTPPPCHPIPRLRLVLPFSRRGAGHSLTGGPPRLGQGPLCGGTRRLIAGGGSGGRGGSAEGQREPGGRIEAKTGLPPTPTPPTPASGGQARQSWGRAGLARLCSSHPTGPQSQAGPGQPGLQLELGRGR